MLTIAPEPTEGKLILTKVLTEEKDEVHVMGKREWEEQGQL